MSFLIRFLGLGVLFLPLFSSVWSATPVNLSLKDETPAQILLSVTKDTRTYLVYVWEDLYNTLACFKHRIHRTRVQGRGGQIGMYTVNLTEKGETLACIDSKHTKDTRTYHVYVWDGISNHFPFFKHGIHRTQEHEWGQPVQPVHGSSYRKGERLTRSLTQNTQKIFKLTLYMYMMASLTILRASNNVFIERKSTNRAGELVCTL